MINNRGVVALALPFLSPRLSPFIPPCSLLFRGSFCDRRAAIAFHCVTNQHKYLTKRRCYWLVTNESLPRSVMWGIFKVNRLWRVIEFRGVSRGLNMYVYNAIDWVFRHSPGRFSRPRFSSFFEIQQTEIRFSWLDWESLSWIGTKLRLIWMFYIFLNYILITYTWVDIYLYE